MRILKLAAAFAMTTGLVACSGDDGGISTVDAARIDAGMDALNLTGVGQLCNDNSPCPSNAMICLTFSDTATNGYCTPLCQDDHMATTNAQGQFPQGSLTLPAAATQMCVDAFSGSPGSPRCGLAIDIQPAIAGAPAEHDVHDRLRVRHRLRHRQHVPDGPGRGHDRGHECLSLHSPGELTATRGLGR
jgi:hypothetical protein